MVSSFDNSNNEEITAVEANLTKMTWSNPTLLKLFSNAITPWIS